MKKQRSSRKAAVFGLYFSTLAFTGYATYRDGKEEILAEKAIVKQTEMDAIGRYISQMPGILSDLQIQYDAEFSASQNILDQLSEPCADIVTGWGYKEGTLIEDVLEDGSCTLDSRQVVYIKELYEQSLVNAREAKRLINYLVDDGTPESNVKILQLFAAIPEVASRDEAHMVELVNGEYEASSVERPDIRYFASEAYRRKWRELLFISGFALAGLTAVLAVRTDSFKKRALEKARRKDFQRFNEEAKTVDFESVLAEIVEKGQKEKWGE
jgi:hypothetical protein